MCSLYTGIIKVLESLNPFMQILSIVLSCITVYVAFKTLRFSQKIVLIQQVYESLLNALNNLKSELDCKRDKKTRINSQILRNIKGNYYLTSVGRKELRLIDSIINEIDKLNRLKIELNSKIRKMIEDELTVLAELYYKEFGEKFNKLRCRLISEKDDLFIDVDFVETITLRNIDTALDDATLYLKIEKVENVSKQINGMFINDLEVQNGYRKINLNTLLEFYQKNYTRIGFGKAISKVIFTRTKQDEMFEYLRSLSNYREYKNLHNRTVNDINSLINIIRIKTNRALQ